MEWPGGAGQARIGMTREDGPGGAWRGGVRDRVAGTVGQGQEGRGVLRAGLDRQAGSDEGRHGGIWRGSAG